jgi:hypothetical protein
MTQEELQEYARRQPFEAFRVVLTTGTAYDRMVKLDLLQVVAARELPSPPPGANGPAA